jgi:hypothetical protein
MDVTLYVERRESSWGVYFKNRAGREVVTQYVDVDDAIDYAVQFILFLA